MKKSKTTTTLKEILAWLKTIERQAADCYALGARALAGDPQFAAFLSKMAEEESEHLEQIEKLETEWADGLDVPAVLALDEETRRIVEAPFARIRTLIEQQAISRQEMARAIAEAEFCEWNEIFLYVIDLCKGDGREFQKAVAEIEHHRREIEQFLMSLSSGERLLSEFGHLQPVWSRRILVVEDDPAVAALLKALVRKDAEVTIAADGLDGLVCLRDGHYDVVISDIEMPRMNGVDMFVLAAEIDPDIQRHFIFFTGTDRPDLLNTLRSSDAVIIPKLSSMDNFRKLVDAVAAR